MYRLHWYCKAFLRGRQTTMRWKNKSSYTHGCCALTWCQLGFLVIKDKTKVACRMNGIEWRVVYFRKLLFETNNEKFSPGRVKSKKIRTHPGGNLCHSGMEVSDTWVKVSSYLESVIMECVCYNAAVAWFHCRILTWRLKNHCWCMPSPKMMQLYMNILWIHLMDFKMAMLAFLFTASR